MKNFFILLILSLFFYTGCKKPDSIKSEKDEKPVVSQDSIDKLEAEIKLKEIEIKEKELAQKEKELQQKESTLNQNRQNNQSQTNIGDIEGYYTVGSVSCNIYSNLKIHWNKGQGYNYLKYSGNAGGSKSYEEYDAYGKYSGKFIFYNNYSNGTFVRADGTEFNVKKIR